MNDPEKIGAMPQRDRERTAEIRWHDIPGKGRGVTASEHIPAGTLVEHAPVLVMPKAQLEETLLDEYCLWWSDDHGGEYAVGLGLLMIYNHSDNPNIAIKYDYEDKSVRVVALRDIKAGEELCWDYKIPLWFKPL